MYRVLHTRCINGNIVIHILQLVHPYLTPPQYKCNDSNRDTLSDPTIYQNTCPSLSQRYLKRITTVVAMETWVKLSYGVGVLSIKHYCLFLQGYNQLTHILCMYRIAEKFHRRKFCQAQLPLYCKNTSRNLFSLIWQRSLYCNH